MSKNVQIVFALVLLGVSGFVTYRWWTSAASGTQDMAIMTSWICKNPECGLDFEMTTDELIKKRVPGTAAIPCPKCGQIKTRRAYKCPNPECGRNNQTVGHDDIPEFCQFCKEPLIP